MDSLNLGLVVDCDVMVKLFIFWHSVCLSRSSNCELYSTFSLNEIKPERRKYTHKKQNYFNLKINVLYLTLNILIYMGIIFL